MGGLKLCKFIILDEIRSVYIGMQNGIYFVTEYPFDKLGLIIKK